MIPADPHTKRLERRIHNQRVQLAWWADWDGARWGFTHMRRLHKSMMAQYNGTNARRHRMRAALQDISDMEGQEGMDDQIFAEKALALANAALDFVSAPQEVTDGDTS